MSFEETVGGVFAFMARPEDAEAGRRPCTPRPTHGVGSRVHSTFGCGTAIGSLSPTARCQAQVILTPRGGDGVHVCTRGVTLGYFRQTVYLPYQPCPTVTNAELRDVCKAQDSPSPPLLNLRTIRMLLVP